MYSKRLLEARAPRAQCILCGAQTARSAIETGNLFLGIKSAAETGNFIPGDSKAPLKPEINSLTNPERISQPKERNEDDQPAASHKNN